MSSKDPPLIHRQTIIVILDTNISVKSYPLLHERVLKYEYVCILKNMSATKELFTRMSYNILSKIVRSSHRFQHKFV
jgi:hypothetical protein